VFGYQTSGSSRTLFLFGITVSVVTSLGLHILLADLQPAASRAAEARRTVARLHREDAFINQDRDTRLEHQLRADHAAKHPRRATGHDISTQ
jgi:hypothetical protein